MPVRNSQKPLYPANWKEISFKIRTIRARGRCEDCSAENLKPHPVTGSKVVICVAHLDHNPQNCDGMEKGGPMLPKEQSNLRAWCQRCHNRYDGKNRRRMQAETLKAQKNQKEE